MVLKINITGPTTQPKGAGICSSEGHCLCQVLLAGAWDQNIAKLCQEIFYPEMFRRAARKNHEQSIFFAKKNLRTLGNKFTPLGIRQLMSETIFTLGSN